MWLLAHCMIATSTFWQMLPSAARCHAGFMSTLTVMLSQCNTVKGLPRILLLAAFPPPPRPIACRLLQVHLPVLH